MLRMHSCTADSGDVDELVASVTDDLTYWLSYGNIYGDGTTRTLIYKVLQRIRISDPNAYDPRVLSIGPYHYGAPSLLSMEKEKWLCLDYVLKLNRGRSLHDYLAAITALEREARICYAEDNIMNSKTFVEMLLLDSCFVLVCLNGIGGTTVQTDVRGGYSQGQDVLTEIVVDQNNRGNNMEEHTDRSQENTDDTGEQWYNSSVVYDLLLLENQIPFFVVVRIYELLVNDEDTTHKLLTDNLSKFMEGVLLHLPLAIKDTNRPKDFDHLLHLCYLYFKPSICSQKNYPMKEESDYFHNLFCWCTKYFYPEDDKNELSNAHFEDTYSLKQLERWRRAEEYHEAGVEFEARIFDEHDPHSLLDIEFKKGIIHIPCLPIDDKSGTLFRNLLAFEQTCPALGNDIACYVYFISQLISVPDDVALLSRKGVIVHQLDSDEEVSTLFAKLFEYVVFDFSGEYYLKSVCHAMEKHYQNRVNRWISWLWHTHFGNPWLGFTALASVVMIVCSIGQTILAFLSYMSV